MTMQALSELLEEKSRLKLWQDYTASMVWIAARRQYKEFPFPSWIDMTQGKAVQDIRTADEIRADLIARLTVDNKDVNE